MLGPGVRKPLLYCAIYSKAVFCLLQSFFLYVLLVEAIHGDFLGSLLWHITKSPTVPFIPGSGTTVSVGLLAAFSQITSRFTCWGRTPMYQLENLGGKSQLDYKRESDQLHLPPPAFRNSLLRRAKRFCSDRSGAILLSLFSWEQMPQEGMKLSSAKTGMTVSTEALRTFVIEQVSCRKPGMPSQHSPICVRSGVWQ